MAQNKQAKITVCLNRGKINCYPKKENTSCNKKKQTNNKNKTKQKLPINGLIYVNKDWIKSCLKKKENKQVQRKDFFICNISNEKALGGIKLKAIYSLNISTYQCMSHLGMYD